LSRENIPKRPTIPNAEFSAGSIYKFPAACNDEFNQSDRRNHSVYLSAIVKKVVFCIATLFLSAALSNATLLLNETFTYPDGPLVTASTNLWVHHSGSADQVMVMSGRVYLSDANTEDVNRSLPGQPYAASGSTNVFYTSFTVRFTSLPTSGGAYFAHFKDSSTTFRARIWALTAGAATGKFRLGISSATSSAASVTNLTDLSLTFNYTVVTRFVNNNSVATCQLWIDPTAESDPGVSFTESASGMTVVSYALRENTGEGALSLDNLRIGTTFADVYSGDSGQPPAITAQSQNQAVTNGASVTLSVTATGTLPLGFQWQFNGTNLPGATSSNLVLSEVTFAQSGFYTCVATNAASSVVSAPISLNVWSAATPAFSYLTYNCNGNGLTNWGTNTEHVLAIGRQVMYLNPDIITFQEIPVTNNCTAQMWDFVAAFCPGYYLVTNAVGDGFIQSVILSRYPILSSVSRLHASDLTPYGYSGSGFTRDLFEAQVSVPGFPQPLHVFTAHLKANQDADSSAKRAAESGAISNFFATVYLAVSNPPPYLLSGDLNEDILRPPASNPQSIQRLVSAPVGLQLTTPINPYTASELTISIRAGLDSRYDYILPCMTLFTNVVSSQVFRTDLLTPLPPNLFGYDDTTASDHLPMFMVFANPYNLPFRLLSIGRTNQDVSLKWETISGRQYHLEISSDLATWMPLVSNLTATDTKYTFTTNLPEAVKFFRVYREP
jgi:endonuclease/exonuclease/phosphatase family metal-dependent hydrolase